MKRVILIFALFITVLSCKKDNDSDGFVTNITHRLSVKYDDFFGGKAAEGVNVKLTNLQNGQIYTVKTDAQGKASVVISAGTYDISASISLSAEQMKKLFGEEKEASFNASLSKVTINAQQNAISELVLQTGKTGDLLIKQVYYVSSDSQKAAGFQWRDQFFEVHNNSNETIYLDNICFAQIHGWYNNFSKENLDENGQIDWSKSPDLVGVGKDANTKFVYAYEIYAFPGNGTTYPLASGKSMIVAKTAMNHKAPLTIGGKKYEVPNPELTVDLSKAKFEVYLPNQENNTDIDNPAVNMEVRYKINTLKDMVLNVQGRDAYVLFRATKAETDALKVVQSPAMRGKKPDRKYLQIPVDIIIDGVGCQEANLPKRLPTNVDAGALSSPKGAYSSESAIRKETKRVGDKIFYQDTNNSTNDFIWISTPDVSSLN